MTETVLLQAVRLKGRLNTEAAFAAIPIDAAGRGLDALRAAGTVQSAGTSVWITGKGPERLAELLATERAALDQSALQTA
jgi:hypothetical protein